MMMAKTISATSRGHEWVATSWASAVPLGFAHSTEE